MFTQHSHCSYCGHPFEADQARPRLCAAAEALLQASQPPLPELALASPIDELAALSAPFILARDDYHVIRAPASHQQHAFLLEHQPPHLHHVIVTREDPPWPILRLSALAAQRQLTPGVH